MVQYKDRERNREKGRERGEKKKQSSVVYSTAETQNHLKQSRLTQQEEQMLKMFNLHWFLVVLFLS